MVPLRRKAPKGLLASAVPNESKIDRLNDKLFVSENSALHGETSYEMKRRYVTLFLLPITAFRSLCPSHHIQSPHAYYYRQLFVTSLFLFVSVSQSPVAALTQQMDAMPVSGLSASDLSNVLESALTMAGAAAFPPAVAGRSSMLTLRGEALTSPANTAVGLHTTPLKTSQTHNVHNRIMRANHHPFSHENAVPFTQQHEPLSRNSRIAATDRQTRKFLFCPSKKTLSNPITLHFPFPSCHTHTRTNARCLVSFAPTVSLHAIPSTCRVD